jgi:hypothetical protein
LLIALSHQTATANLSLGGLIGERALSSTIAADLAVTLHHIAPTNTPKRVSLLLRGPVSYSDLHADFPDNSIIRRKILFWTTPGSVLDAFTIRTSIDLNNF